MVATIVMDGRINNATSLYPLSLRPRPPWCCIIFWIAPQRMALFFFAILAFVAWKVSFTSATSSAASA